jgi:hypothetical protein
MPRCVKLCGERFQRKHLLLALFNVHRAFDAQMERLRGDAFQASAM